KLLRSRPWLTSHLVREAHSSAAATVRRPSFACVISLCSSSWTSPHYAPPVVLVVKVKAFGAFPEASFNTLLSPDDVQSAMTRHLIASQFGLPQFSESVSSEPPL